ncbi:hypothetical protein [Vulcanococcus sp.]|uniref:hypothetical protein n=1 Tax=Vulcanococcus sp. TaxID=2856995 RepID=UPI003C0B0E6A
MTSSTLLRELVAQAFEYMEHEPQPSEVSRASLLMGDVVLDMPDATDAELVYISRLCAHICRVS